MQLTPNGPRGRHLGGSLALIFALAVLTAACGSDAAEVGAADSGDAESSEAPTTTEAPEDVTPATTAGEAGNDADGYPVTVAGAEISSRPQRIVSLSPSSTEILFAVGAGDQVIAVDSFSYFPEEAPVTDLSGFEPSLEAIASFDPDLVILSFDPGEIVAGLEAAGVPTILHPPAASPDDAYAQMADLGMATGNIDAAAEAVADTRARIAAAVESIPERDTPLRVYHELDDTFFSASSFGFVGSLYGLMGVENIADEADADQFGFPQLSPEYIIDANPSVIVITDQVGYMTEDVAARPGWDTIDAVASENVIQVNADTASRWGPRMADFVETMAEVFAAQPVG